MGELLALLTGHLVDARRIDQEHAARVIFLPAGMGGAGGFAMQRTGGKAHLAEQSIEQRRLADADPAKHGNMDMTLFELFQQQLQLPVILGQRRAHRRRHALVIEQFAQAIAGQRQMGITVNPGWIRCRHCHHPAVAPKPVGQNALHALPDLHSDYPRTCAGSAR